MRRTILAFALLLAAVSASAGQRFSYIYARAGSNAVISKGSLDEILRLKERFTGSYLWVRMDGREYLIRDANALAEVDRACQPLRALEPEQRALRHKMKPLEHREDQLEDQIDEITDSVDDEDERMTEATRARLRDLEQQLRVVERELKQYEREEEDLDRREDELDRVFDGEVQRIADRAIRNGIAERVR
jgi:chromosome segregation ATPase